MIRRSRPFAALIVTALPLALAACAHGAREGAAADSLPTEQALSDRGRLYAACVKAASDAGTVTRFGAYLRFTCAGPPAKALFDEIEIFARARGQEEATAERITRHFSKIAWDDQCWMTSTATPAYGCLIDLPAGRDFIDHRDMPEPAK